MSEQMIAVLEHDDAFIALICVMDILEEIFHIFSWVELNIHQKAISFLNVNGVSCYGIEVYNIFSATNHNLCCIC